MHRHTTETLVSTRLILEPLAREHASPMVDVLAHVSLYTFTGGTPPTLAQLEARYAVQVAGISPDGAQHWLNWIVRRRDSDAIVGFVQATVEGDNDGLMAEVAWLINPAHQGQGFASEATRHMILWLRSNGVDRVAAFIHPEHAASIAVARHQGLRISNIARDGEIRWDSQT
nr:hypothetical protein BJQ95_00406 [Cryobacterium sp. SO1]